MCLVLLGGVINLSVSVDAAEFSAESIIAHKQLDTVFARKEIENKLKQTVNKRN